MDTIHSCRRNCIGFFSKNPDSPFRIELTPEKLMYMENRYSNSPNPNMKGMSYLPQEGDDGIGYRYTQRKIPEVRPD